MALWLRNASRLPTTTYSRRTLSAKRQDASNSTETADSRVREWISKIMSNTHVQDDLIDPYELQLLNLTLPLFNGSKVAPRPEMNTPIIPGTELTLFPPLVPTEQLFADGTDPSYSAPSPFFRRMWAGGEFAFDPHNPLRVGDAAREHGFAVVERRTHVYRPELVELPSAEATGKKKITYHSDQLPPDEQFTFTPSAHTLFRFSALTFNAHRIHLDPIYSQQEGHEDRLVHGPMTALLLLRFARFKMPSENHIAAFKYRATHPLVVDRPLTLNLAWTGERRAAEVWATNQEGIVGMRGSIVFT
ncbi:hypothetical protein RSAG8_02682, partial [Rhizoctonia solani AG-8 WAC10335]